MSLFERLKLPTYIETKKYKVNLLQEITWLEVLPYINMSETDLKSKVELLFGTFVQSLDFSIEAGGFKMEYDKEKVFKVLMDIDQTSIKDLDLIIKTILIIIRTILNYES